MAWKTIWRTPLTTKTLFTSTVHVWSRFCFIPDVVVLPSVPFHFSSVVRNTEHKCLQHATIVQRNWNVNFLLTRTVHIPVLDSGLYGPHFFPASLGLGVHISACSQKNHGSAFNSLAHCSVWKFADCNNYLLMVLSDVKEHNYIVDSQSEILCC